jgi:hypothetical protein
MTENAHLAPRLWARVEKASGDGCWEWNGSRTGFGHGQIGTGSGRTVYTHRLSYELAHGPIPDGLCVLHRCDNPPCCRPDHLFLGTRSDNMADKVAKGRQQRGERAGNAVLTEEKVMAILAAYATGEFPVLTLANEYGANEATMRAIVNGQTWTHVPGPRLSREEVVAIGRKHRAAARAAAKEASGWQPGACSICRQRGHYAKTCSARKSA